MPDHLPAVYERFRERYPGVAAALDACGAAGDDAGPLDDRSRRLVKLGIAVGAGSEGAVRSSTRKALELGITPDELRHVAVLTITTAGFPAAIAGLGWIEEVLVAEA
jgi:4-carboxymuconolactone decarboxylase